jgi:thiol-disulfide isomerase/thioredoxin
MRTMKPVFFALSASAAVLYAGTAFATPGPAPAGPLTGPQIGQPAPAFSLTTVDGHTVSNASLRGKTVVINVWATWCPPCREETPDLLKAYAKLKGPGVAFLGVDTTEQAPLVRAFVAAKGIPYPQAIGDAAFESAYAIANFPTTIVIDPSGILRARYISGITASNLMAFVQTAKEGRDVALTSKLQSKIDALLDDPSIVLTGDAASIRANAKLAYDTIGKVEDVADNSDSGDDVIDYLSIQAKETALRDRAIAALSPVAAGNSDKVLLALLQGDAAASREQWPQALGFYQTALAIDPNQEDALSGAAGAASRLKQHDQAAAFNARLVALEPDDVTARITYARSLAAAKQFPQAYEEAGRATALARQHVAAKPGDQKLIVRLAWAHLYAGRIFAQGGEAEKALSEFAATQAAAQQLPPANDRYAMYIEEAQEATIALGLGDAHPKTAISLVPWTGADLPGSVPSTIKYRLAVAGSPGASVDLAAKGLPKGWVASFCTDRLCAPFRVQVALPASGVKVIEFQLIPDKPGDPEPRVTIEATDGASSAQASNIALER